MVETGERRTRKEAVGGKMVDLDLRNQKRGHRTGGKKHAEEGKEYSRHKRTRGGMTFVRRTRVPVRNAGQSGDTIREMENHGRREVGERGAKKKRRREVAVLLGVDLAVVRKQGDRDAQNRVRKRQDSADGARMVRYIASEEH